jgi:hypothetical protein
LSSFDSSINNRSIHVAHGLVYSLACQLLLLLCKSLIVDVLILYISCIIVCANNIFSLYTFPSTHSKDDDECGGNLKPMAEYYIIQYAFSLCSSQLLFYFYSSQQFHFFLLPSFVLTPLHFFFHCCYLLFLYRIIYIHVTMNSKTLKMCTTSNNKYKLLLMITSFFFILELLTRRIHFFTCPLSFN